MRNLLSKIIFKQGAALRNPSLDKWYGFLTKSDSWTISQLKAYQLKRLKELLLFVEEYSPYYKAQFSDLGIKASDCSDLNFLQKLPSINKAELLEHNESLHSDKSQFDKLFFCETSGSTGQVLTFYRNESWDSANRAAIMRGYSWHGVLPWERNLYFWGYNLSAKSRLKVRLLDALQNRFRLFDYSPKSIETLKRQLKGVVFIHGYSSMIYELAKILNREDKKPAFKALKMIKGTSEKIFPHYNQEIQKAFGTNIVSEYGAAEAGIIAFECAHGNMHLNMEGCIVEHDEEGEILVTNLHSYSFPIIRYKLGDYIRLAPEGKRCPCGKAHHILEEVTGRVGKSIQGNQQNYPSLTLYYIFKNLFFEHDIKLNYQAHQFEKGKLEIRIVESLNSKNLKTVQEEADKYFKGDILVTLVDNSEIHTYEKKLKDFISHIE